MTIEQDLQRGLQLHQAGRVLEAAEIYRSIIKTRPQTGDAWNLLSAIFFDTGNTEAAVAAATQATALMPDFFPAFVNLGNALQAAGRINDALIAFSKAAALDPDSPEAQSNLASALNALGRHQEALAAAQAALELKPDFPEALNNRGNAEAGLNRLDAAVGTYRTLLRLRPDSADAYYNLGGALMRLGALEEAIGCYRTAVRFDPDGAEKHFNLGNALRAAGLMPDAETSYRNALILRPGYRDALYNLGAALQGQGRLDEAEASYREVLTLEPDSADVHWNLALVLLQKGNYRDGWQEYEWRWRNPDFPTPRRDFDKPAWNGEDLTGKTILIHAEQGYGDAIEFCRYVPLVAKRGGRVVLESRPALTPLFATLDGVAERVSLGDPLPDFDCHVPLMSLPRVFGTTLESVPADIPYLGVPAGRTADPRIAVAAGLKVGFVWAGSRTRQDNSMRSCTPRDFATLFTVPDTTFFSLQVDDKDDALAPFLGPTVVDLGKGFADFADTAAAIRELDLVVTVDTAVAHLAGALGKPVWVLLAFSPSFLWLMGRDDSPWYPGVRLFRQTAWGDWTTVFIRVKEALRERALDGKIPKP